MNKKTAVMILGLLAIIGQQAAMLTNNGYKVAKVMDGDTFETVDRAKVRFDTLDAPELTNCGGIEAKVALEKLISGQTVRLQSEARDFVGRQIASVWVGETWIDLELIKTGWVKYSSSTVDKEHVLKNLDLENRKNKLGIYSEKCTQTENKTNPKCKIKGNIISEWEFKGDKMYHMPGCIQYKTTVVDLWKGEQWFCTEKEAKEAGYKKSGGC